MFFADGTSPRFFGPQHLSSNTAPNGMNVHHSRVGSAQAVAFDMIEGHRKEMIRQVHDTPLFRRNRGILPSGTHQLSVHRPSAHGAIVQHSLRVRVHCRRVQFCDLVISNLRADWR